MNSDLLTYIAPIIVIFVGLHTLVHTLALWIDKWINKIISEKIDPVEVVTKNVGKGMVQGVAEGLGKIDHCDMAMKTASFHIARGMYEGALGSGDSPSNILPPMN